MNLPSLSLFLFYIWWLLVNGFVYYSEYLFLSHFLDSPRYRKQFMWLYIGTNCMVTFLSIYFQMYGILREFVHISILCIFSLVLLKCKLIQVIAPVVIILTLSTLMEGISTTIMRLLVTTIPSPFLGYMVQMVLTAALALAFYTALRLTARQYLFTARRFLFSYLYILLLPCAFVVWITRYGLGLDSDSPSICRVPFTESPPLWAFLCITGALATFWVTLIVFQKLMRLSMNEMEKALLDDQLHEQSIYLAEARKRDDRYRAFQHDINNHLLILSGLIKERKYQSAEQYFARLRIASGALLTDVSTGNSALDILLKEKLNYAKQNKIAVTYNIKIPDQMSIDDVDLCVVFANALDNAVLACLLDNPKNRSISITVKLRHQFMFIEVTNPTQSISPVKPGTGLNNIRHIAEKYQGTLQFEKSNGFFHLNVLLCWNQKSNPPFTKPD